MQRKKIVTELFKKQRSKGNTFYKHPLSFALMMLKPFQSFYMTAEWQMACFAERAVVIYIYIYIAKPQTRKHFSLYVFLENCL